MSVRRLIYEFVTWKMENCVIVELCNCLFVYLFKWAIIYLFKLLTAEVYNYYKLRLSKENYKIF